MFHLYSFRESSLFRNALITFTPLPDLLATEQLYWREQDQPFTIPTQIYPAGPGN